MGIVPVLCITAKLGRADVGQLLGQAVGGGVAGAIVTAIAGLIKNSMAGQAAR
jgi:outer membrane lipoprotein SlyB